MTSQCCASPENMFDDSLPGFPDLFVCSNCTPPSSTAPVLKQLSHFFSMKLKNASSQNHSSSAKHDFSALENYLTYMKAEVKAMDVCLSETYKKAKNALPFFLNASQTSKASLISVIKDNLDRIGRVPAESSIKSLNFLQGYFSSSSIHSILSETLSTQETLKEITAEIKAQTSELDFFLDSIDTSKPRNVKVDRSTIRSRGTKTPATNPHKSGSRGYATPPTNVSSSQGQSVTTKSAKTLDFDVPGNTKNSIFQSQMGRYSANETSSKNGLNIYGHHNPLVSNAPKNTKPKTKKNQFFLCTNAVKKESLESEFSSNRLQLDSETQLDSARLQASSRKTDESILLQSENTTVTNDQPNLICNSKTLERKNSRWKIQSKQVEQCSIVQTDPEASSSIQTKPPVSLPKDCSPAVHSLNFSGLKSNLPHLYDFNEETQNIFVQNLSRRSNRFEEELEEGGEKLTLCSVQSLKKLDASF